MNARELTDVGLTIWEDEGGANGDITRSERIDHAASRLVDYVCEYLLDQGIRFEDQHIYRVIERMVASARIAQFEDDAAMWPDILRPTAVAVSPTEA